MSSEGGFLANGRLIELLGLTGALRLVNAFGGRRLYLPHPSRLKRGHQVALAIGEEAAARLCAAWPSTYVTVPKAAVQLRRQRDRAIRADRDAMSVRQLAAKYNTTERHVYRVLSMPEQPEEAPGAPASAQGSLF